MMKNGDGEDDDPSIRHGRHKTVGDRIEPRGLASKGRVRKESLPESRDLANVIGIARVREEIA